MTLPMMLFTETEPKRLYVKGVSSMSLFSHLCECGKLNVHGFWHQLRPRKANREKRYVEVHFPCKKCDIILGRRYKLTTARSRPRMIDWISLGFKFSRLLQMTGLHHTKLWVWSLNAALFLEKKLPL